MDSLCSRAAPSVDLTGVTVSNFGELISTFPSFETSNPPLVGDLSLGSWRGLDLFEDFSRQLSIDSSMTSAQELDQSVQELDFLSYQNLVGQGIDSEARGDLSVRLAFSRARVIATAAKDFSVKEMVIFWGFHDLLCEASETYFVRFLKWWLEESGIEIYLVSIDSERVVFPDSFNVSWVPKVKSCESLIPEKRELLLGLIPGVVSDQDIKRFDATSSPTKRRVIKLNGDQFLIPPEFRLQASPSRLLFDQIASLSQASSPLHAYAQVHGNNFFVEPEVLISTAWTCFAKGATELAIRYITRALQCSRNVVRAGYIMAQLQGMRISSQKFPQVADVREPEEGLPDALRSFLYQAKGWGCVMVGRHSEAKRFLSQSLDLAGEDMDFAEKCYCENINALNEMRSGHLEEAFRAEKGIERAISEANQFTESVDHRLIYINCINLARLYRRRGSLKTARKYFDRAFQESLGNLTENDHIYWDVCLAQVAHEEGNHSDALRHWLRVALNWLTSELPEAIGSRTIRSITLNKVYSQASKIDVTTEALIENLLEVATQNGIVVDTKDLVGCDSPAIVSVDVVPEEVLCQGKVVVLDGLVFIECPPKISPPIESSALRSLRLLIFQLIRKISPLESGIASTSMLVIDRRGGLGVGKNVVEGVESMLWHQVGVIVSGSGEMVLSEASRQALLEESTLRLGMAVSAFDTVRKEVAFKRYRSAQTLRSDESDVLLMIEREEPKVREILDRGIDPDLLVKLRDERVIDYILEESACCQVGIK